MNLEDPGVDAAVRDLLAGRYGLDLGEVARFGHAQLPVAGGGS